MRMKCFRIRPATWAKTMCPPSISTRKRVLARACVTTPSTSSASSFCFVINACESAKLTGRPATEKIAPVCSPQRLAESYNPSIGSAGGSSQIAGRGVDIPVCQQRCQAFVDASRLEWQARMPAPRADCNGKTARSWAPRCQNAAVLSEWLPAGYHPTYPFAVQLSIHDLAGSRGATRRRGIQARTAPLIAVQRITKSNCLHVARTAKNYS